MEIALVCIDLSCLSTSTLLAVYDTHPVLRKRFQCFDLVLQAQEHSTVYKSIRVDQHFPWQTVHRCLRYICFATTAPEEVAAYRNRNVHAFGLANSLLAFNYVAEAERLCEVFGFPMSSLLDGLVSNGRQDLIKPWLFDRKFGNEIMKRVVQKPRIAMISADQYERHNLWGHLTQKTWNYIAKFCILALKSRSLVTLRWLKSKLDLTYPKTLWFHPPSRYRDELRKNLGEFPQLRLEMLELYKQFFIPEVWDFVKPLAY